MVRGGLCDSMKQLRSRERLYFAAGRMRQKRKTGADESAPVICVSALNFKA